MKVNKSKLNDTICKVLPPPKRLLILSAGPGYNHQYFFWFLQAFWQVRFRFSVAGAPFLQNHQYFTNFTSIFRYEGAGPTTILLHYYKAIATRLHHREGFFVTGPTTNNGHLDPSNKDSSLWVPQRTFFDDATLPQLQDYDKATAYLLQYYYNITTVLLHY